MPIVERVARQLAHNASRTYDRLVYLHFYLEWRWLRTNFPSWREYYGEWND